MPDTGELLTAGTPAGPHLPGRRNCVAPGCNRTAAIRRMVRGPDGRLYGSTCARKLFGTTSGRGRTLNDRGAVPTPGTLFDPPTKEQPAMSQDPTTSKVIDTNTDPTIRTGRRFVVERFSDPTEASGLGIVLDGILWPDGTVSVRWRGDDPSFVNWPSLAAAERKHCYGGRSRIVWIDTDPDDMGDDYFRATYRGPHRATFTFNTNRMATEDREDLLADVTAWAAAFGLNPDVMPGNAPITFDTAAGTVTTRYVVLDPDDVGDSTGMVIAKRDAAGRPVTEDVTLPYTGTIPPMPTFLDRPAPSDTENGTPTA